jgi:hypothetical protein
MSYRDLLDEDENKLNSAPPIPSGKADIGFGLSALAWTALALVWYFW